MKLWIVFNDYWWLQSIITIMITQKCDYGYDYNYTKHVIDFDYDYNCNQPKPVNPYLGQHFTRIPIPSTNLGMKLIIYTIIIYVKLITYS